MSEFKQKLISGWIEADSKTKSYLMGYRGLKTQHEHVFEDAVEHGNGLIVCEELGDDFPIENHISPNCQSRDV